MAKKPPLKDTLKGEMGGAPRTPPTYPEGEKPTGIGGTYEQTAPPDYPYTAPPRDPSAEAPSRPQQHPSQSQAHVPQARAAPEVEPPSQPIQRIFMPFADPRRGETFKEMFMPNVSRMAEKLFPGGERAGINPDWIERQKYMLAPLTQTGLIGGRKRMEERWAEKGKSKEDIMAAYPSMWAAKVDMQLANLTPKWAGGKTQEEIEEDIINSGWTVEQVMGSGGLDVASIPQVGLEGLNLLAQLAEHYIGLGEQAAGFEFLPRNVQIMLGQDKNLADYMKVALLKAGEGRGAVPMVGDSALGPVNISPIFRAAASRIAKNMIGDEEAERLLADASVEPNIFLTSFANLTARERMAGMDTVIMDNLVQRFAPEVDWEKLVGQQTWLVNQSKTGVDLANWDAAEWTYEGLDYMMEAQQRLSEGEDWDTVSAAVEDKIPLGARLADLQYQILLDPLNLVDVATSGLKLRNLVGKNADNFLVSAVDDIVRFGDEVAEVGKVADKAGGPAWVVKTADDLLNIPRYQQVAQATAEAAQDMAKFKGMRSKGIVNVIERIPVLGELWRRPASSMVNLMAEETATVLQNLFSKVDNLRAMKGLAEVGITDISPLKVMMEVFMNPAADNVLGSGRSAPEIIKALGLTPRIVQSAGEASALGVRVGTVLDDFASPAALRTRAIMENAGEQSGKVYDLWQEALELSETALKMPGGEANLLKPRKMTQKRQALDLADAKVAQMMEALDDGIRAAAGLTDMPKSTQQVRSAFNTVQGFFANFHMGYSPGWAVRNFLNNYTTAMIDGVATLTPVSTVDDFMAWYKPGMYVREMGSQAGEVAKSKSLIKKLSIYPLNQSIERVAGRKANFMGIKKAFKNWDVGRAIPQHYYDDFARTMGPDAANRFFALVKGAWTPQALDEVLTKMQFDEAWRVIDDSKLLDDLADADLVHPIQEILEEATDIRDAGERISKLKDDMFKAAEDATQNMGFREGSADAEDYASFLHRMEDKFGNLSKTEQELMLNQFVKDKHASRHAREEALTYLQKRQHDLETVMQSLRRDGASPELMDDLTRLLKEAGDVSVDIDKQFARNFGTQDGMIVALWEDGNTTDFLKYLEELTGQFEDVPEIRDILVSLYPRVVDVGSGKAAYTTVRKTIWEYTVRGVFDDMVGMGGRIEDAIRAADPTAVMGDFTPRWDDIASRMPFARPEQSAMWGKLVEESFLWENGFKNEYHLTQYFKKMGLLDPDVALLRPKDMVDQSQFDEFMVAIMQHGEDYRASGKSIGGLMFDSDEAYAAWRTAGEGTPNLLPAGSAHDIGRHRTAQGVHGNDLLTRVEHYVAGALDKPAMTLEVDQLQYARQMLDELHPRLQDMRTVADQVGKEMRDFSLLNYNDRRNLDTLLGFGFSYPYWYSRTMWNYTRRLFQKPGTIAALIKFRASLRRINRDLPEYWQDQVKIELSEQMGPMYFPILNSVDPLNGFLGDKFLDPDLQDSTLYGQFLAEAGQYGPGVHSIWSTLMFFDALSRRNDPDEAQAWMSYLGQPTRAANAMSVLLSKAGIGPPGGIGVEPWLYEDGWFQGRFTGTKWEQRRVAKTLLQMYEDSQGTDNPITMAQVNEAIFNKEGELYDLALQGMREKQSVYVMLSWALGTGFHMRDASEIEVYNLDMAQSELYRRSPYADDPAEDAMTPEEYRLAWQGLREQYPWMDAVYMSRRDELKRDQSYAWTVFNRLPPNNRPYFEVYFGKEQMHLIDQFYAEGLEGMSEYEREEFMNAMKQLGAILEMPEDTTVQEWNAARNARHAMYTRLGLEFGNPSAEDPLGEMRGLEDAFYALKAEDSDAAYEFLEAHPELELYWERKNELVMSDTLLLKYWSSMDLFERTMYDEFYDDMEDKHPGISKFWDEYYRLKDTDPDAASDYWADHPEFQQYLNAKNLFELDLRDRLESMGQFVDQLNPMWTEMRGDASITTERQRRIAQLIQESQRPIGEFELPEDLTEREVFAAVNLEIASIPSNQWGDVYDALRDIGDLDDVFTAFREFRNAATTGANMMEVKALLVALEQIRDAGGWSLVDEETPGKKYSKTSDMATGRSGGWGGSSRGSSSRGSAPVTERQRRQSQTWIRNYSKSRGGGGRMRSKTYGGISYKPQSDKQKRSSDETIRSFLATLKDERLGSPTFHFYMRHMSGLDSDQQAKFLRQNPHFARWLNQSLDQYPPGFFSLIMDYLQKNPQGRSTGRKSYRGRAKFSLFSNENL